MEFEKGYKGKGMCKHCWNSIKDCRNGTLYCNRYNSWCKKVARNCTGIKYPRNA